MYNNLYIYICIYLIYTYIYIYINIYKLSMGFLSPSSSFINAFKILYRKKENNTVS